MLASLYVVACKMLDIVAQILWLVATSLQMSHFIKITSATAVHMCLSKERKRVMQLGHGNEAGLNLQCIRSNAALRCSGIIVTWGSFDP